MLKTVLITVDSHAAGFPGSNRNLQTVKKKSSATIVLSHAFDFVPNFHVSQAEDPGVQTNVDFSAAIFLNFFRPTFFSMRLSDLFVVQKKNYVSFFHFESHHETVIIQEKQFTIISMNRKFKKKENAKILLITSV